MSMISSLLNSLQYQYNMLNNILSRYGIKMYLYKVRTRSEACETCIEYVTVVEFASKDMYEAFINTIKAQSGDGGSAGDSNEFGGS